MMGQGITRDLVVWSDFDEDWVNDNDRYLVRISAPLLVQAYADTLEEIYLSELDKSLEDADKIREKFRKNLDLKIQEYKLRNLKT